MMMINLKKGENAVSKFMNIRYIYFSFLGFIGIKILKFIR
jgi:predicted tellurium resistance membrane protein TerC